MAPITELEDPSDLSRTGWGVIFAPGLPRGVRTALEPLLELRRRQAALRKSEYYRDDLAYRPGMSLYSFLQNNGTWAGVADADRLPYYILIVGSPEEIPFQFQFELSLHYGVGRIYFESVAEFSNYVSSVVSVEEGRSRASSITLFGVSNPNDPTTQRIARDLIEPLSATLATPEQEWPVQTILGQDATKNRLRQVLSRGEVPAIFLSTAHGIGLPPGDPRRKAEQGSIICQDWPGPEWEGGISRDQYFSAEDIPPDTQLLGLIAFLLNDFSAGASGESSFISRLAQRLLSHPEGGALAVVGVSGRLWTGVENIQVDPFRYTFRRLLRSHRLGWAMSYLVHSAMAASSLQTDVSSGEDPFRSTNSTLVEVSQTVQMFILGDPAVRPFVLSHFKERPTKKTIHSVQVPELGELAGAFNDQVASTDQLNFRNYLWALADLIESVDTEPPLTIGILGSWGMGKSFILGNLPEVLARRAESREGKESLESGRQNPRVLPVFFNAWEYDANESIWPALARKIVDSLEKKLTWKPLERFWIKLSRSLRRQLSRDRGWIALGIIALIIILGTLFIESELDPAKAWAAVLTLGGLGLIKILSETLNNSLGQWVVEI